MKPLIILLTLSVWSKGVMSLDTPKHFDSVFSDMYPDVTPPDKNSFDFGEDFFVEDIVEEMQKMGMRPMAGACRGNSRDCSSKPKTNEKIVEFSLDYSDDDDTNMVKRDADVSDILSEPVKGERQARLFYNFDRGSAFNTSVAFTIPLFSFTLPGAGDVTDDGYDGNVFGTMAFVSLFLLGGLGVAIYTTTQGALGDDGETVARKLQNGKMDLNSLTSSVYEGLNEFAAALDLPECSHLAVCEAYQNPDHYGFMAVPFKIWAPLRSESAMQDLPPHEAAAKYATEGGICEENYSCIVDPIHALDLVYDFVISNVL